jgi:hypothetical protein
MKKASIFSKVTLGLALASTLVAGTAFADWATYTPTKVGCFDNGTCYIVLNTSVGAWSTCATKTQVRWKLSQAGGAEMYRTALAAFMAGRTLDINTYTGNTCVDGYPQAYYLNAN